MIKDFLRKKSSDVYSIHLIIFLFIGCFGIISSSFQELYIGIKNILTSSSILLTDYMAIGGMGSTLLNASVTSLLTLFLYKKNNIKPNGSMIMSLWLTLGFSMIGKNFLNIWPTIIGVYIYSKIQKDKFYNYILIATLSTALAPLSTEIFKIFNLNIHETLILSSVLSIVLGMIIPPLAKFTLKIHQGYNLYNVGFANGLVSIALISIFNYFGVNLNSNFSWSTEYKTQLLILILILMLFLCSIGVNKSLNQNMKKILKHSGRTVTDYYLMYKNSSFFNMGLLGTIFLLYILIIDGDLNGAVIALLFCIIGFGALGKHALNTIPIVLGVILTASIGNMPLNNPSILLTTLGSTALAPIAGQFGFFIGILAGFFHLILMKNIGHLSGGINLYNNGFIAGIVAMTLIPIIDGFKKGD